MLRPPREGQGHLRFIESDSDLELSDDLRDELAEDSDDSSDENEEAEESEAEPDN